MLRRLLGWLLAYYRLQARCFIWALGAFRILPRPLTAALLRRIPPARRRTSRTSCTSRTLIVDGGGRW